MSKRDKAARPKFNAQTTDLTDARPNETVGETVGETASREDRRND